MVHQRFIQGSDGGTHGTFLKLNLGDCLALDLSMECQGYIVQVS